MMLSRLSGEHFICKSIGGNMKTRIIMLMIAFCFITTAVCFATAHDAHMGTWKLNESKSKLSPTAAKNNTVIYEGAGEIVKVTIDGVNKDGKAIHNEWTGKFDGQDYPVTGDPTSDMRSYKVIDDHTTEFAIKKDGKITASGKIVVSKDGKSRIVTSQTTDASGKKVENISAYDKQ
jgi:hypothetical protein